VRTSRSQAFDIVLLIVYLGSHMPRPPERENLVSTTPCYFFVSKPPKVGQACCGVPFTLSQLYQSTAPRARIASYAAVSVISAQLTANLTLPCWMSLAGIKSCSLAGVTRAIVLSKSVLSAVKPEPPTYWRYAGLLGAAKQKVLASPWIQPIRRALGVYPRYCPIEACSHRPPSQEPTLC